MRLLVLVVVTSLGTHRDRPAVTLSQWNGGAGMTVRYDTKRWAAVPYSPTASSGRVRRKR